MSRRILFLACGLMLTAISVQTVDAGWREFHRRSVLDYQRNKAWPQPWVHTDRMATCQIFDLMAQNGWCQQSTLTTHHFHPTTQQLTEAGRMKVHQILKQHPPSFRTMFVVTSADERTTATRMDSVQTVAAAMLTDGSLPEIQRVNIPPRGWPAEEINLINAKFQQTIPSPRLPTITGSATTSN